MYRIGEFSIINKVTVKTLRYYDSIDLFKPSIVDKYTGYRYYDESQQATFDEITKYKDLGFSLDEIKLLINSNEEEKKLIIKEHLDKINESIVNEESKHNILKKMLKEIPRVEYSYYLHKPYYLKKLNLKNRNIDSIYDEIKIDLEKYGLKILRKIFINHEIGYEKENIDALIGFEVEKDLGKIDGYFLDNYPPKAKSLIAHGKINEIDDLYKDIVIYSKDKNYQIRGEYIEVYDKGNADVYVESFNLNEINEDEVYYLDHYKPNYEIDERLIGRYKIKDILPSFNMFNPDKQKNSVETKYNILELKGDGTTNFDNIKWNKKELMMEYDNRIIPIHIHLSKLNDKYYLDVLFNEDYKYYKSQRPMLYIYECIK